MMCVYVIVDACMPWLCVCVYVAGVRGQISGVSFPFLLWDLDLEIELRLSDLRTKYFYPSHFAAPSIPILSFILRQSLIKLPRLALNSL